jgi:hypothetical protein
MPGGKDTLLPRILRRTLSLVRLLARATAYDVLGRLPARPATASVAAPALHRASRLSSAAFCSPSAVRVPSVHGPLHARNCLACSRFQFIVDHPWAVPLPPAPAFVQAFGVLALPSCTAPLAWVLPFSGDGSLGGSSFRDGSFTLGSSFRGVAFALGSLGASVGLGSLSVSLTLASFGGSLGFFSSFRGISGLTRGLDLGFRFRFCNCLGNGFRGSAPVSVSGFGSLLWQRFRLRFGFA